jgi:uncharacterized phiE125 gp8 family phage protein
MKLTLATAPLIEPVDLTTAKVHLRVDDSTDDELIESLLLTARVSVENDSKRSLLTSTWDYSLSSWPIGNSIKIPNGNLRSVTHVKYKDSSGTETTIPITDYIVEDNGDQCGKVVLKYGVTWPSVVLWPSNPITIRFVCGWLTAADVPPPAKSAVLVLCAKLYESRGEDIIGQTRIEDETYKRLVNLIPRLYDEF